MTFLAISAAKRRLRTEPRLVEKIHFRPVLTGPSAQRRILLLDPCLDLKRISFVRPAQWLLWRDPHLRKESPHRSQPDLDAHALLDQIADDPARPETKVQPVLAGIPP